MIRVYLKAVGLGAPGLNGWHDSVPFLSGAQTYPGGDMPKYVPTLLPPNERRRTSRTIRLALQVAEEAMQNSGFSLGEPATVFASSEGDAEIADKMCTTLTLPGRPISPTVFHNSVHNAAAGYWAIATGSREASTSIACGEGTFAAGLLEAAAQAAIEELPVLLAAYDYELPATLRPFSPAAASFGVALLISPKPDGAQSVLSLDTVSGVGETPMANAALERLRTVNPAARSLPLLKAVARREAATVTLPYLGATQLEVHHKPC